MIDIKLEKFEGPLSLLLKMIENEELDITEVSLAKIADQYIDYIKNSSQIDPEEMADFLVVAARLLLIKSRALLPFIYPEEEKEIEDLEKQLKMYKEFIEAAKEIEKILKKKKFMFARVFDRKVVLSNLKLFSPPKNITAKELSNIFHDLISRLRAPEKMEEKTIDDKIKIEDKITTIRQMLFNRIKSSFNNLIKDAKSKTEIIVSFLAMLELIKQHDIMVSQNGLFKEIIISKTKEL